MEATQLGVSAKSEILYPVEAVADDRSGGKNTRKRDSGRYGPLCTERDKLTLANDSMGQERKCLRIVDMKQGRTRLD